MTLRWIVCIVVKNQASGEKWFISEVIVDTVRVYIYSSSDEADDVFKVEVSRWWKSRMVWERLDR